MTPLSIIGRIYLSRDGTTWKPYKIMIGEKRGSRVIIGSRGEQFHMSQGFTSRQDAVDAAKARASAILHSKYGAPLHTQWDVVDESAPVFNPIGLR